MLSFRCASSCYECEESQRRDHECGTRNSPHPWNPQQPTRPSNRKQGLWFPWRSMVLWFPGLALNLYVVVVVVSVAVVVVLVVLDLRHGTSGRGHWNPETRQVGGGHWNPGFPFAVVILLLEIWVVASEPRTREKEYWASESL